MALKRLDEEFDLKPGTQLLPYMKRLLPSLEGRFQSLEATAGKAAGIAEEIRAAALLRMNEILIPATEDIIAVTKLGFLLGPSSTLMELKLGPTFLIIDEGPQRASFTPSPYLIVERVANIDDYAIARLDGYTQETGELLMTITAWHGNAGPWSDWMVSSTPGMADSTKLYHDAVAPMHAQVEADTAQVAIYRDEILAAAEALEEAGLDAQNFIRRDGSVPYIGLQAGVHPPVGANDAYFATTAWSRARMIEYAGNALLRTGGTMTGPLTLAGAPAAPLQAATKAYVDSIIFAGGVVGNSVTINAVNPTLRLQATGTGQMRQIEALGAAGMAKWVLRLADNAPESGGETGSNFVLLRYADNGTILDSPFSINRQTGITSVRGLSSSADINVIGDLSAYRAAAPTTGVVYLNQTRSAYLWFNGSTHVLAGGGVNTSGGGIACGPLSSGHINCYSIYTQGHPITTWGLTSHGNITVNGTAYVNGGFQLTSGAPTITMYDNDWGPMYIHNNQGLIGFLNHASGWIWYVNTSGHFWTPAYGWLHDYVHGTASSYAWNVGNHYWSQTVSSTRWVHAGDIDWAYYYYQLAEIGNAAITGMFVVGAVYAGYTNVYAARWRQLQHMINGGWYTSGWAS